MSSTGTLMSILFLTLMASGLSDIIRVCKKLDTCRCQFTDDHTIIDLWDLAWGHEPLFKNYPGDDGFEYSYSPCREFDEEGCKDSVLCQRNGTQYKKLTNLNVTFIEVQGHSVGLSYNYNNISSIVYLTCNEKDTMPIFKAHGWVPGIGSNHYVFNMTSKHACPFHPSSGGSSSLSAGGVILILFFVAVFLYLFIGVLDAKFRKKASGLELIPHIHFWTALPKLVSDGLGFVITCGCCTAKNGHTYDKV